MDQSDIIIPSPAVVKIMCEEMHQENVVKHVREEALQRQRGRPGLPEVLPLREGRDDVGVYEADIPKHFYWSRRQKYGRELFTTDAGMKDLKKHHPEFFPKQVSGKITAGYGGKYDGHTPPAKPRVQFGRGTLELAPA